MIIDTAGDYTLRYTATDECGNSTTVDRNLKIAPPRTVLYTDGTFIINEAPADMDRNEQEHGVATNIYSPLDSLNGYNYTSQTDRPWNSEKDLIKTVLIGSPISPRNLAYWFSGCSQLETVDLSGIDSQRMISMLRCFRECVNLKTIDLGLMDMRSVTNFSGTFSYCQKLKMVDMSNCVAENPNLQSMFESCWALETVDLSKLKINSSVSMSSMFRYCSALTTIYASNEFSTANVTSSANMFANMSANLVGGAGTVWSSSNPTDKTYAHIDGGTSDPGYFTAKPSA